jgi:Mg2+/Co2+ transporter CorB
LDEFSTGTLLAWLVGLLIASGVFSIAETSMMAVNRFRLRHLASQGHRGAKRTLSLLERTDKLLGVILLGNNLINAAAATLVTVIAVRLFGNGELALSVATLAVTFAILVVSEITPKVIGAAYPEKIALPASYLLAPLLKIAYPIVWFVNLFVNGLLALLRLKPSAEVQQKLTLEELRTLVLEGAHYIPAKHQSILLNLFELQKITVDDTMTPRNQIEAIDFDGDIDGIRNRLATAHHTLQPVYRGELEEIIGIVHVRRVLHQAESGEFTKESLREILQPPYFVPAGTPLLTQLQNFQETKSRVALVVDEYGELQGLVTVEDIMEEIVGEFGQGTRVHGVLDRDEEAGSLLVEGGALVRELNRKLGLKFNLAGPKTVNGLILEHLEDIPEPGTSLKIDGYPMEIVQTQDRMVKVVRIYPQPAAAQQADEQLPLTL